MKTATVHRKAAALAAVFVTTMAVSADDPPARKGQPHRTPSPALGSKSPVATPRRLQNSVARVDFEDGVIRYYRKDPHTGDWRRYLQGACVGASLADEAAVKKIQEKHNVYYLFQGAKVSNVTSESYKGSASLTFRIARDALWVAYRLTLFKETPYMLLETTGSSRNDLVGTGFVEIENPAPSAIVNNAPDPEQENLYTSEGHADATWNLSFQHYLTAFSDKAPGVYGIFPAMANPYPQNMVIKAGNLGHFEFALPFFFAGDPGPDKLTRDSVKAWTLNQLTLIKPFRPSPPAKP